jgi:DMSO/TMAO reductase YedYZ molybdopterin-dependent catalytic subunit
MNDEPYEEGPQTGLPGDEQAGVGEAPAGGTSAELQLPEPPTPPRGTRYTRRWFLVIGGAFVAAIVGVYELFVRGGKSGGGATKSISNLFADFPLNNVESVPKKTWDQWTIKVDGLVDTPLTIDGAAWKALPRYEETVDFHCVEGWSVSHVKWGGVTPAAVLDKAGVKPEGKFVVFHAYTGEYADSLPMDLVRDPQTVLADMLDGQALPADHGGPVRLAVPKQLGYKSVKWVTRIEVTAKPVTGYWEQRGYPQYAPVKG